MYLKLQDFFPDPVVILGMIIETVQGKILLNKRD